MNAAVQGVSAHEQYLVPERGMTIPFSSRSISRQPVQRAERPNGHNEALGEAVANQAVDGIAQQSFSAMAASGHPLAAILSLVQCVQDMHLQQAVEHLGPSREAQEAKSEQLARMLRTQQMLDPATAFRAPTPTFATPGNWSQPRHDSTEEDTRARRRKRALGVLGAC